MSSSLSAYVDTNVLVSFALGEKDERFHVVEPFFDEVSQKNLVIHISRFVLSEALHALRNIATTQVYRELSNKCSQRELIDLVNTSDFKNKVRDRSLEAFKTIIDLITRDPDHFKLEEPETSYSEKIFKDGFEILSEIFGEFRVYRFQCPKCDSFLNCNSCGFDCKIHYKGINAPDITHALISSSLKCQYFVTADKYFSLFPKDRIKSEIKILT